MRKTTRKVAFLLTPGFLGFDFNIFHCNTFCLVYLPVQHCRKPISGNPDLSIQKQGFLDGFLGKNSIFLTVISFVFLTHLTCSTAVAPPADLTRAFSRINEELRSQYSPAYRPPNARRDGTYRAIRIVPVHKGYTIRCRSGYYAPDAPTRRAGNQPANPVLPGHRRQ